MEFATRSCPMCGRHLEKQKEDPWVCECGYTTEDRSRGTKKLPEPIKVNLPAKPAKVIR